MGQTDFSDDSEAVSNILL